MALLHAVLDVVQNEFAKKEPKWKTLPHPTPDDLAFLDAECATASKFDPYGWRLSMYQQYQQNKMKLIIRECEYGRVVTLIDDHHDIPWGLWGRILRLYAGDAKRPPNPLTLSSQHAGDATRSSPARVFFLASPHLRTIPSNKTKPVGPAHINGGYTYTCNNQTVMIYRAEDATRVLIHELQHASCLDHHEDGVDLVEAETEAWAELLYVALLSQGNPAVFQKLLQKQVMWMMIQNDVIRHHIRRPRQFPWRYTVGKEDVWRRWGLLPDVERNTVEQYELRRNAPPTTLLPTRSLRLTAPPSADIQRAFGVEKSNVL